MEGGESLLEAIYEDTDMFDVEEEEEEGEIVEEHNSRIDSAKSCNGEELPVCFENRSSPVKKKKKNKKKRKRRGGPGRDVTDINRFVLDICRRLKEKKSYMVYTAVGCLGISRLTDLVKEVDVIQSCGGQITVDGGRYRTGGGILWNILKTKEPMAYQEIMKKAKDFEKQFKRQNINQAPQQKKEVLFQGTASLSSEGSPPSSIPNDSGLVPQNQDEQPNIERKHTSVHDRIRIPVSYDDILGDDDPK
ncbi:uncharacterized protein LOC126665139 [Mercurialis annua]|uniref:uncharacterized protein LOC126665139 n=1 Tax=Mercurialis annua TaxID=3986 RepID=UPI00215EB261|nr:uncharacterized protein LOC126665139 [Mercurialis annua]